MSAGVAWRRGGSLARRARELGVGRVLLVMRAFWLLALARGVLLVFPVERVIRWKQRPPRFDAGLSAVAAREQRRLVRHAVLVAARYSPVRFVCFPQCLAACALLRERGIASRLHYGVTREGGRLATHTWLESGGEVVIGGEVAGEYSTLAVY